VWKDSTNNKELLSKKVADGIEKVIEENNISAGEKLPNENKLSEYLNVSRSTIREAIKLLVAKNVLEVKRGVGTFVTENPGIVNDPLGMAYIQSKDLFSDLVEVRLIIEPQVAFMAANNCDKELLSEIEEISKLIEIQIDQGVDHTVADMKFHELIAKASANPVIERVMPIINDAITKAYNSTKDLRESKIAVKKQHRAIVSALKTNDAEQAKKAMEAHINYGKRNNH